ncbi:hypothetical protein IVB18_26200 [Bradyrhizobium sp. 186]|uniref:hypothetical protein n=1 Tax=Bradyrhizobium sp. 186 TaxID=2782654 RepID=UPI0020013388|nr:hypothetical protein [Bradyrhizobium sp. 186]UPK31824.1 hypothetical protein IVB18_26200 [Bradyrhizobium sp. 186]
MASIVSICNLALSNLGKDNINALSEPTPEARACNQFYEHTRDLLLQGYPWRFATRTIALALVTNDKAGKWAYAYKRPNDCLKVLWLRPSYSADNPCQQTEQEEIANPYEIEGEVIYCNLSTAFLRYIVRLVDPTKFPPLFVEALSWHLSVKLSMPLTRDPKVRADAFQLAQRTQGAAEMADANEVRETSDIDSDFLKGRSEGSAPGNLPRGWVP